MVKEPWPLEVFGNDFDRIRNDAGKAHPAPGAGSWTESPLEFPPDSKDLGNSWSCLNPSSQKKTRSRLGSKESTTQQEIGMWSRSVIPPGFFSRGSGNSQRNEEFSDPEDPSITRHSRYEQPPPPLPQSHFLWE